MNIQSLSDLEKRALARISIAVYGEELARIMIPELSRYLDESSRLPVLADLRPEGLSRA
jgi:hypothetical protein